MYPRLLGFRSHTAVVNRPEERRPARVRAILDEVLALDAAQAAVDARLAAFGVGAPAAICADPERLVRRLEDGG